MRCTRPIDGFSHFQQVLTTMDTNKVAYHRHRVAVGDDNVISMSHTQWKWCTQRSPPIRRWIQSIIMQYYSKIFKNSLEYRLRLRHAKLSLSSQKKRTKHNNASAVCSELKFSRAIWRSRMGDGRTANNKWINLCVLDKKREILSF